MLLDLSYAEKAVLVGLLKATIAADRFPLSPRVRTLRLVLDKLEPPLPAAEQHPPPKPPGERSTVSSKKRRR